MSGFRFRFGFVVAFAMLVGACGTEEKNNSNNNENNINNQQCTSACQCTSALRSDALSNGNQILGGVALSQSTPIKALLADIASYDGQVLQIEGTVTARCPSQGCWATLEDAEGYNLNLKVIDGLVDFRQVTEVGQYLIGEGVFTSAGEYGAQLSIDNHGAMSGTIVCQ